jgi:hypothetical protein
MKFAVFWYAVGSMIILYLLLDASTGLFLPVAPFTPHLSVEQAALRVDQIGLVGEAVDRSVSMMFSITLGLFVLVGFALRETRPSARGTVASLVLGACFVAASVTSIYFGYLLRFQSVHMANYSLSQPSGDIERLVAYQATAVALTSVAAMGFVTRWLKAPASGEGM